MPLAYRIESIALTTPGHHWIILARLPDDRVVTIQLPRQAFVDAGMHSMGQLLLLGWLSKGTTVVQEETAR